MKNKLLQDLKDIELSYDSEYVNESNDEFCITMKQKIENIRRSIDYQLTEDEINWIIVKANFVKKVCMIKETEDLCTSILGKLENKKQCGAKMKTAEKMFEELGYSKSESREFIKYWKTHGMYECIIMFEICRKLVFKHTDTYEQESLGLTTKELQAVNQQVKELGWL